MFQYFPVLQNIVQEVALLSFSSLSPQGIITVLANRSDLSSKPVGMLVRGPVVMCHWLLQCLPAVHDRLMPCVPCSVIGRRYTEIMQDLLPMPSNIPLCISYAELCWVTMCFTDRSPLK